MESLLRTNAVRAHFDNDGDTTEYNVSTSAPYLDSLRESYNTHELMLKDGINPSAVKIFLESWIASQEKVHTVVAYARHKAYAILVCAEADTKEAINEYQISIDPVRSLFGEKQPVISIVRPSISTELSTLQTALIITSNNTGR